MAKKLFLLDGHALVYRAHFAFINRPLINSKGLNTSAITGFVRTLWDIIQNEQPTHIAVSFDTHEPTFRHEMFPEYKANREEALKFVAESRLNQRIATERARRDAINEAAELARILNDRDTAAELSRKLDEINKALRNIERATRDLEYELHK